MADATTIVLLLAAVVMALSCVAVMHMWRLRHVWEISAREVPLLTLNGIGSIVTAELIFAQMLLTHHGHPVSCRTTLWASYSTLPCMALVIFLRGAKLLILYSKELREKYGKHFTSRRLYIYLAAIQLEMSIVALVLMYIRPQYRIGEDNCDWYLDWPVIYGLCVMSLTVLYKMNQMLKTVDDAFGISQEVRWFMRYLPSLGVYYVIVHATVGRYPALGDALLVPRAVIGLILCYLTIINSFLIPLYKYHRQLASHGYNKVYSGGSNETKDFICSIVSITELLQWSELQAAFATFALKNLCGESMDFLLAVVAYESNSGADAAALHQEYSGICTLYLAQGACSEVNIGDKLRKRCMKYVQDKVAFQQLAPADRLSVLSPAKDEVVAMINQNLLIRFKHTPDFQKRSEAAAVKQNAYAIAAEGAEKDRDRQRTLSKDQLAGASWTPAPHANSHAAASRSYGP